MKEYPAIFSTAMVQAILDNRKKQTRRIIKPQPARQLIYTQSNEWILDYQKVDDGSVWKCPYGKVGDRLFVRETWAIADDIKGNQKYYYKADGIPKDLFDPSGFKWKPSIHMPKDVCRLRLGITNIRVERLQDISEEDAIAEGVDSRVIGTPFYKNYLSKEGDYMGSNLWRFQSPIHSFQSLWISINGRDSWVSNPCVWVVEFQKCQ